MLVVFLVVLLVFLVLVTSSPMAANHSIHEVFQDEAISHGPEAARPDRRLVFKVFVKQLYIYVYCFA